MRCSLLSSACPFAQLDEIKTARGQTGDEGGELLRPLAEVLRENKDRKQQAFDDQWKQMKTGDHLLFALSSFMCSFHTIDAYFAKAMRQVFSNSDRKPAPYSCLPSAAIIKTHLTQ